MDVPINFHGSDFVEARRDGPCAGVVRAIKEFEIGRIGRKKVLFVENGEVEVVERGRVIGGWEPKGVLKIINSIIVRCKEQKLGAFIVEADRTCREIGEDGGNGEHRISRGLIHVVAWSRLKVRRPVDKSVSRDWMGSALHIHWQAGVPYLPRGFFIVAVGDPGAGGAVEVRVVHSHLCEICISGTA